MQTTVGQYLLKADDMSGVTPLRCARHRIHRPLVRRLDHPLWRVVYVEHLFDRWNKRGGFDRGPVSFIFVRHNLMKPADNEAIAWLRLRRKKKTDFGNKDHRGIRERNNRPTSSFLPFLSYHSLSLPNSNLWLPFSETAQSDVLRVDFATGGRHRFISCPDNVIPTSRLLDLLQDPFSSCSFQKETFVRARAIALIWHANKFRETVANVRVTKTNNKDESFSRFNRRAV